MKAIVHSVYGPPGLLEFRDVEQPVAQDDEVLVRVHAAAVNPYDWHQATGAPYIFRIGKGIREPKLTAIGLDFAGQVEAVGRSVTRFQPGDEVFGLHAGAFAEYVCVPGDKAIVKKPASLTYVQAAALPVSALSALQGLRDKGRIQPGQRVLINGAAGGIGTFAIQIATSFGAHVTGVCGTRNLDLVRSLGADEVLDYTRQDFTGSGRRYDLILDMMGNRTIADRRRALTADGIIVVVGGPAGGRWLGAMTSLLKAMVLSRRTRPMLTRPVRADLVTVGELVGAGTVTPAIDRHYPLSAVPDAIGYLGRGHARGKIIIDVP